MGVTECAQRLAIWINPLQLAVTSPVVFCLNGVSQAWPKQTKSPKVVFARAGLFTYYQRTQKRTLLSPFLLLHYLTCSGNWGHRRLLVQPN